MVWKADAMELLKDWAGIVAAAFAVVSALFGGGFLTNRLRNRIKVKRVRRSTPELARFAHFYDAVFGDEEPFEEYQEYISRPRTGNIEHIVLIALYRGCPYGLLDFQLDKKHRYAFISYLATADDKRIAAAVGFGIDHQKAVLAKQKLLEAAARRVRWRIFGRLNACVFEIRKDAREGAKVKAFQRIFNANYLKVRSPIVKLDIDYKVPIMSEGPGAPEVPYSLYYYSLRGQPPPRLAKSEIEAILTMIAEDIYLPSAIFPQQETYLAELKMGFLAQVPDEGLTLMREGRHWHYADNKAKEPRRTNLSTLAGKPETP